MLLSLLLSAVLDAVLPSVDTLSGAVVVSSVKSRLSYDEMSVPVTSLTLRQLEAESIGAPKSLSGKIPGLMIPDYGSSMTSTIYIRGIGSRMENPVMGLYLDDIPVLDKNNFDFSFLDIRRVDMLRGPQGTLYGRNAMLGVMSVETLSPDSYQGVRASVEYGSASSMNARASVYCGNTGAAAMFRHCGGMYRNSYTGKKCDVSDAGSFRLRNVWRTGDIGIDNTLSASYTDEGGYPYRQWDGTVLHPVNYNGRCSYRRLSVMDGLRLSTSFSGWNLSSVTSFQLLFDKMELDQDFTSASMFTLQQRQRQYVVTQELVLKPSERRGRWDSQSGIFLFYKRNGMGAPVEFLQDGIRTLILDNANAYIPEEFGKLSLLEDRFPISSDFTLRGYNAALYHESYFRAGKWLFTAGLRIDHEGEFMRYDSRADIHFRLSAMPSFLKLHTVYEGTERRFFLEVLPKVSALFDASSREMASRGISLKWTASVSRGYKSGGFNTQLFSDILQNRMMDGMMEKLGVHMDAENRVSPSSVAYRPESCMDYELGGRFSLDRAGHLLRISAAGYFMDCTDQQITVFPSGSGTGRMMANAGKSRSAGVEAELQWRWKGLGVNASASWNDARFVSYDDGREDYSGNRIPYSPASMLYVRASYCFGLAGGTLGRLSFAADISGTGKVSWNEAGDICQSPYSILGADIRWRFRKFEVHVRGDNLSGTDYRTFYFKSVGNSFFQTGRPRRFNAGVSVEF